MNNFFLRRVTTLHPILSPSRDWSRTIRAVLELEDKEPAVFTSHSKVPAIRAPGSSPRIDPSPQKKFKSDGLRSHIP
jgi:hypothetical protein